LLLLLLIVSEVEVARADAQDPPYLQAPDTTVSSSLERSVHHGLTPKPCASKKRHINACVKLMRGMVVMAAVIMGEQDETYSYSSNRRPMTLLVIPQLGIHPILNSSSLSVQIMS
jgi:hypothetical protein